MKLLVIEDEVRAADYLKQGLSENGYSVDVAHTGTDGLHVAANGDHDLVILDIMLPGIDGFAVLSALRTSKSTPVLLLTARGQTNDKVRGFDLGADDYLVKPFSTRELLLRIKALLRRTNPAAPEEQLLTRGVLSVDTSRHRVTVHDQEITLTTTEFKLLLTLAERPGRVQSRERLLQDVWGYSSDADTRTVDTHITRLRNKLVSAGDMIKTIRGYGYKLEVQ